MKQVNLFGNEFKEDEEEKIYSSKIQAPVYEPKNKKPFTLELYDKSKHDRLIKEINASNISEEEKKFLTYSATRHIVFNYEKIADYYANSSKEIQSLMERSALVIIDFEKAIENGYVRLSDEIRTQYMEDYGE
jgi:hypothetical protein